MLGSSPSPLVATYEALSEMAKVTDALERAMREFRFAEIEELTQRNTVLRKQLTRAKQGLHNYRPSTEVDIEQVKQLRPLTVPIANGGRRFAFWRTDIATRQAMGNGPVHNALKNLPKLRSTPRIGALKDAFKGRPAIITAAGPLLHNAYINDEIRAHAQKRAAQDSFDEIRENFEDMRRNAQWLKKSTEHALAYASRILERDHAQEGPVE